MKKVFSTCLVLTTFLSATNAFAAGLPGAATPGGAMPKMGQPVIPAEKMPSVVIPPLKERPMNAEEGAKITVSRFELEGAIERPGMIDVAEVKELVEKQRQKYPAGMTMGQMQLVADEVMTYYRNHGLILARAYIAAQTVSNDVVKITIMEGKLGAVHAEGGAAGKLRYPKEVLEDPFQSLIGQPVVKDDLESSLLQLLDYPGLKYNAVVKPGTAEGTADLYLNVTEERLLEAVLGVDNYGSKYTGEYRPRLDVTFNNPTKAADKLQLFVIDTLKPNNELYGGFSYERPLAWGRNSVGIDFENNSFDVGDDLESLHLAGSSETRDIYLKHVFKRTRKAGVSGLARLASKTAETTFFDSTVSKDDLTVLSLETNSDYIDQWFGGGMTNLNVSLARGISGFMGSNEDNDDLTSRSGANGQIASTDFWKLNGEYSRLQKMWTNTTLLFRLQGQTTDSMLVSLEQFALGGPDTVRAYPQAEYMMDQGYFTSFEFNINAPGFADRPAFANRTWGEVLQFSIFYDAAAGWLKDASSHDDNASGFLSGAGVGLHFALPGRFVSSLSVATPIGDHVADDDREFRTYFNVSCKY